MGRVRDWLIGRHTFRGLVVVDPEVAKAHGGRLIAGTRRAEFVQVATGTRDRARIDAAHALHTRVAEMPGATLEAILDGGSTVDPGPRLCLVKGGRPRLMLVGHGEVDDAQSEQRRVDHAVHFWGLPVGRYAAPSAVDPEQQARWSFSMRLGAPFGIPLLVLVAFRLPEVIGPDGWPTVALLFRGVDPLLLGAGLGLLLPPGVVGILIGRSRSWPVLEWCLPFVAALVPSAPVLTAAGVLDGAGRLFQAFPGVGMVVMSAVLVASVPLFVLMIAAARWWAALGWGVPLVAGGIAVSVGDVLLEVYLRAFGLVRTDVQVSLWAQWSLGASAVAVALLGIYLGAAWGVLGRRVGINRWLVALIAMPLAALSFALVVDATTDIVRQRAHVDASGLPRPLPGLQPRLACVAPVAGPYSYVGQPLDTASGPVVYFGRADGRLAVWSEQAGGVLLDGQAVGLRFVQPGSTCS